VSISPASARDLAAELHTARLDRRPVERITDRVAGFGEADAYAVQEAGIALRSAAGEHVMGAKLGFTSVAMQRAMGVDSPNYGWLTDAMALDNREVPLGALIHPKVEPEIGFVLGHDLDGPAVTATEVMMSTAALVPCLEIVDSRYRRFEFSAFDNIADDSSAGFVITGAPLPVAPGIDLRTVGVVVTSDGETVHAAAGAAVLEHPAAAVAWLVRRLAAVGRGLEAGWLVISGGLTGPVNLIAGRTVRAEIDRIGDVELRCEEE
jgi:2-oxo-3-hexenedioate decarboxylase